MTATDNWPCSTTPAAVTGGRLFATLALGGQHACGVTPAGKAFCWGADNRGQLGDGTLNDQPSPVGVGGGHTFARLTAGSSHTCGIATDARILCWGSNLDGQVGDGTKTARSLPVTVAGGRSYRDVAAGSAHTCALTTAGKAFCWGFNFYGQTGTGTRYPNFPHRLKPTAVVGGLRFTQVAAGYAHTCAVASTGKDYCWGLGEDGELGNGSLETRTAPVPVAGGIRLSAIGINQFAPHSCGITSAGAGYCWGRNLDGELGDGTLTNQATPVTIVGTN